MKIAMPFPYLIRAATGLLAVLPLMAMAVDGVVLIDQNKALAGGATPGDTAGYPITITQPGSYRLAGNLTVPSGMDGIVITVPNVTIDLNGFAMIGDTSSGEAAIRFTGPAPARGLAIRNGSINGWRTPLLLGEKFFFIGTVSTPYDAAEVMLKDLYLNMGVSGVTQTLYVGGNSTVNNVVAGAYRLIVATCPSTIVNSVFNKVTPYQTRCLVANTATAS